MDGRGVPEIVQAGLVTRPRRAADAGVGPELAERLLERMFTPPV
jgi:hypothetical protein